MNQIKFSQKERRLTQKPVWYDTYLHLKYKLVAEDIVEGYQSLGLMTCEDIRVKILRKLYPTEWVQQAIAELTQQGYLDVVFRTKSGALYMEDLSLPLEERFRHKIPAGLVFDPETGEICREVEELFAIPQSVLNSVPEAQEGSPTILERIRRWFR